MEIGLLKNNKNISFRKCHWHDTKKDRPNKFSKLCNFKSIITRMSMMTLIFIFIY